MSRHTIFAVIAFLSLLCPAAKAQTSSSSITGRVLDSAGSVVQGANITLWDKATGTRRSAATNADGEFRFEQLAGGEIQLTVNLSGFSPVTRELNLTQGENLRLDLALDPASVSDEVTVTAARVPTPLSTVPASVTVLDSREIEQQAIISRNLNDILARTVPGIGPSREAEPTFGQSLRGRDMLVLIDGVPQNFDLRIGATDELSRIDPSTVERIEVVRGATSLYGSAAAGGIVNIITKRPTEGHNFETNIGTTFSATHPSGSFSKRISQTAAGRFGAGDYFLSGTFEDADGEFDADGDRIPQITLGPQSKKIDLNGKLGFVLGDNQRLQFSAGYYRNELNRFFGAADGVSGVREARAVELPLGASSPGDRPLIPLLPPLKYQQTYRLDYEHNDVFGSSVKASLFYLDYFRRNVFAGNLFGGQLLPNFDKKGFRLDIETPLEKLLPRGGTVAWGFDFVNYRHAEPLSNGLPFVPALDQKSYAGFAQFNLPVTARLTFRGGLRHEQFRVGIDDFTTHPAFGGRFVRGGTLGYGATTFNVGGVYSIKKGTEIFASFAQGFSITEVGRLLRNTRLPSVAVARPEAQKVNNYEFGFRQQLSRFQYTLSGFYSTSQLGTTFFINPSTGIPEIIRAPEKVGGFEATFDARVVRNLTAGGTFSYQRGEHDPDRNGEYTPLPGFRIAPPKLTLYGEHTTFSRWRNRLQLLYTGERDVFGNSVVFGEGRVRPVWLLDFASDFDVPRGTISVGVANLLNRSYVPVANQAFNSNSTYIAGRGTTITINYAIRWGKQ